MKNFFYIGILSLITFFTTSCGGSDESTESKISLPDPPKDLKYEAVPEIDGPLSGYVEAVPGSYLLELTKDEDSYKLGYSGTMKVKFKFLKSIEVKAGQGYNYYGPSLIGKALDEQGIPFDFTLDAPTSTDLASYLARGSGEEWLTLTLTGQGICTNADEAAKQLENFVKGKKIRFNSEIVEEKADSGNDNSNTSSASGSGSCDELLAGYEKFMTDYIEIIKKYKDNPSDQTLLEDYNKLMTEAGTWASKTSACAGDPAFAAKFSQIQMKIANAASGI
jgi:hypothetical protein